MRLIDEFLQKIRRINYFEHGKKAGEKYHIVHSVFTAYDDWNEQMLKTWEGQICPLESFAAQKIGDEEIDKIFRAVSRAVGDILYEKWRNFVAREHLEKEMGLENEILDMAKRDLSWARVEKALNKLGFFTDLLGIYEDGYFPCGWIGNYPGGKAVVM